jgi:hypothetical protein
MNVVSTKYGGVAVENGGITFVVCIPSRRREALAASHPLLPFANVVVHHSEVDSYRQFFDKHKHAYGAIVPHREVGIANIRNFILADLWPADVDFCVQQDDDTKGVIPLMSMVMQVRREPELGLGILAQTGRCTLDAGVGMFGYLHNVRPVMRHSTDPFVLRNWTSSHCVGFAKRDLRYDPRLASHDDVDVSLQAIAKYGFLWRDDRYTWIGRPERTGGMAAQRSSEMERRSFDLLVEKYGADLIHRSARENGVMVTLPL